MLRIKIRQTATFRMMVFASAAFFLAGGVALGFLYWNMLTVMDGQIGRSLDRELNDLILAHARSGVEGLRRMVLERASPHEDSARLYLFVSADGVPTGNLSGWPPGAPALGSVGDFEAVRGGDSGAPGVRIRARAHTWAFPDGSRLLVGRSLAERGNFKHIAGESVLSAVLANLLVGIAAGAVMARYSLARLGRINRTAHEVLKGDLARRVEVSEADDEYDALARNINAMLDRIQRLVEMVRGVTVNIAHDLRTPLNRLRGRLEVALMSSRAPSEYEAVLQRAIAEADGIVSTFNAMLKIARIRAGAVSGQRYRVDLHEVVEELCDLYQALAEEHGASIQAKVSGDVSVMGDGHLISQAAANLLDNAIKYSPKGGVIELSASREDGRVRLAVADGGPGVPAEKRSLMLEPFVRLDQGGDGQGFGLGLSFVAAVADWHGAELSLSDNGPGLRVALLFPVCDL